MTPSALTLLAPAAAATMALTALWVWRRRAMPGWGELALCLFLGALFFGFQAAPSEAWVLLPEVYAAPLAFNRAVRAGFGQPQHPMLPSVGVLLLLLTLGVLACLGQGGGAYGMAFDLVAVALFADAAVAVLRGLNDDLIPPRRTARIWFLALGTGLGLCMAVGMPLGYGHVALPLGAVVSMALCFVLVGAMETHSVAPIAPSNPPTVTPAEPPPAPQAPPPQAPAPQALDAREQQILLRLRTQMQTQALYRDPALTLSRLAQRLDVPEHRLRRVIHLGEQQGNFSTYLSGYRLAAFKQRLADPQAESLTILALALEVGYSSLSVFNRAFKLAEGCTPSEFRRALKNAATAPAKPSTANTPDAANGA